MRRFGSALILTALLAGFTAASAQVTPIVPGNDRSDFKPLMVKPEDLADGKRLADTTCVGCHGEKRGPFLWEHAPVTDSCTNCHTPHGSNITPLLKSRAPFLCDECHDGPHNSQAAYGTAVAGIQGGGAVKGGNPNSNAVGRACMNCHVMVHGSNSPTGAFLHH